MGVESLHFFWKCSKNAKLMFSKNASKIIYCYSTYQDLYDKMKKEVKNIEFFKGLPSKEDMDLWSIESNFKILVIDDLALRASQSVDIVDLFTIYSHHHNFSVFFCSSKFIYWRKIFSNHKFKQSLFCFIQ